VPRGRTGSKKEERLAKGAVGRGGEGARGRARRTGERVALHIREP